MKTVAIIIPVYNAEKKLKACIKSIAKQTYKNFKCILVDDGSKDNSGKICDQAAAKDNRFVVIHKKNAGAFEARKTGIFSEDAQSCDYVTFVDADDALPKNGLEIMAQKIENAKCDLVAARFSRIWKGIHLPKQSVSPCFQHGEKLYNHGQIISELYVSFFGITDFPPSLYAKLYKTSLITQALKNSEPVVHTIGEDMLVLLNVLPLCTSLLIVPEVVYFYRVGGITSTYVPNKLDEFLKLYQYREKMASLYPMPYDVKKLMDIEIINTARSYLCMCVERGKYSSEQLCEEIQKLFANPIVNGAAKHVNDNMFCHYICLKQEDELTDYIMQLVKKDKWKNILKRILLSI